MNWNVKRFSMLNISQVILMRTDSNLCRKELTVHWSAPNCLIRSYLQPCTNLMWGDESEAVAPIIWLYQIVGAQKEEVFFPELLITLRSHAIWWRHLVDLTPGFNGLGKDNCKTRQETFLGWDLLQLILEVWPYVYNWPWCFIWTLNFGIWEAGPLMILTRNKSSQNCMCPN